MDLDLVVDLRPNEASKAIDVLTELGFVPRLPVEAQAFADPVQGSEWVERRNLQVFTLIDPGVPLREIDLFVHEPIPFEGLWARSVVMNLARTSVRVSSKEDLIRMKRVAARPQDLDDIAALEEIDRG